MDAITESSKCDERADALEKFAKDNGWTPGEAATAMTTCIGRIIALDLHDNVSVTDAITAQCKLIIAETVNAMKTYEGARESL
jgi:hypothetical protein